MKEHLTLYLLAALCSLLEIEPNYSQGRAITLLGGLAPVLTIQGIFYIVIPPLLTQPLEKSKIYLYISLSILVISLIAESLSAYLPLWVLIALKISISLSVAIINTLCISLVISKNPTLYQFTFFLVLLRFMRGLGALLTSSLSLFGFQISRLLLAFCFIFLIARVPHIKPKTEADDNMFYQKLLYTVRQSTFELQRFPPKSKLAYCAFIGNTSFFLTLILSFLNQMSYSLPWLFQQTPLHLSTSPYLVYLSLSIFSSCTIPLIWKECYIHIPLAIAGLLLGVVVLFLGPASFISVSPSADLYLIMGSTVSFLSGMIYVCSLPRMIMALQQRYLTDVFKMRWMVCGFFLFIRGLADLMKVVAHVFPLPLICSIMSISILLISVCLAPRYKKEKFRLKSVMS